MNLTTEQQRWLTEEFLGECQHAFTGYAEKPEDNDQCYKCGKWMPRYVLDFTDWRTFGLLMTELDNRWSDEEIAKFLYTLAIEGNTQELPVRAANYIYELANKGVHDA